MAVESVNCGIANHTQKHSIKGSLRVLNKIDHRIDELLDDKIDRLSDYAAEVNLIGKMDGILQRLKECADSGESYVENIGKRERQEAEVSALPTGFKTPSFNGNVLNYCKWWEQFKSLPTTIEMSVCFIRCAIYFKH